MAGFEQIAAVILVGISLLAGRQAFQALSFISHNKKDTVLKKVFFWAAIGIIAWVAGDFIDFILGKYPSIADAFFIVGYAVMLPAMIFFWIYNSNKLTSREYMLFLFAIFVVMALTVIMLFLVVMPNKNEKELIEIALDFFYPVGSAILFLSTFSITAVVDRKVKQERKNLPLLYLAQGIFFSFLGDVFFSFSTWKGVYGVLGGISDISYILSYALFAFSFYLFRKSQYLKS